MFTERCRTTNLEALSIDCTEATEPVGGGVHLLRRCSLCASPVAGSLPSARGGGRSMIDRLHWRSSW